MIEPDPWGPGTGVDLDVPDAEYRLGTLLEYSDFRPAAVSWGEVRPDGSIVIRIACLPEYADFEEVEKRLITMASNLRRELEADGEEARVIVGTDDAPGPE